MVKDLVIAELDTARKALARPDSIQATKKIVDMARAAEIYARRQQLGEESIRYATSIKMEALRQLGNMLKATPRATGELLRGTKKEPRQDNIPTLSELGLDKKTSKLAQDIAELPEEKFNAVTQGIITLSEAQKGKVHVSNNSGNNEWYTPQEFVDAARFVMKTIDLDPASSEKANRTIKAKKYFTIEDNGLDKKWHGNVWLNPPYAQPLISKFAETISYKFESKEINQACILVNNATETTWFQRMAKLSSTICFPSGRIQFIDPNGNQSGAPLQGQAILYFGNLSEAFNNAFRKFGFIVWKSER